MHRDMDVGFCVGLLVFGVPAAATVGKVQRLHVGQREVPLLVLSHNVMAVFLWRNRRQLQCGNWKGS